MLPLSRILYAGVNVLTLSEYLLDIDSTDGVVQVILPKVITQVTHATSAGFNAAMNSIRWNDHLGTAAIHNIIFYTQDGDTINGQTSYTVNTNGQSGMLIITGTNKWLMSTTETVSASFSTVVDIFTPTQNGQTVFTLSHTINSVIQPILVVNGQTQQRNRDYIVNGTTLQWTSLDFSLTTNDTLNLYYSY